MDIRTRVHDNNHTNTAFIYNIHRRLPYLRNIRLKENGNGETSYCLTDRKSPIARVSRASKAAFRRTDSMDCWTFRSVPGQGCSCTTERLEISTSFWPERRGKMELDSYFEKIFDFDRFFFISEVSGNASYHPDEH